MRKLVISVLSVSLAISLILTGGCTVEESPTQVIENITPKEAFALIQNNQDNPDFIIIDVRTPEEFADGHLGKAINLDYKNESFRDIIDLVDKNKTYLIYCRSGIRSGEALEIMRELGFREVYNMSGGIIEWKEEGLPLVIP
jgi:rhodanese-related sulfurtransferase